MTDTGLKVRKAAVSGTAPAPANTCRVFANHHPASSSAAVEWAGGTSSASWLPERESFSLQPDGGGRQRHIFAPGWVCGNRLRSFRTHSRPERRRFRLIPTRVGNTVFGTAAVAHYTVHPHARGEHYNDLDGEIVNVGSSPRAWGTQIIDADVLHAGRFIPTRVGNTLRVT